MITGKRLRELRIDKGMKLKDVAEALNVTVRSINRYEDGIREPSLGILTGFCKLYNVSADYLLGLTDSY